MEDQQSENNPYGYDFNPFGINILQICYLIAMFDLGQSLYFLVQSTRVLISNVSAIEIGLLCINWHLFVDAGRYLFTSCNSRLVILDSDGYRAFSGSMEGNL